MATRSLSPNQITQRLLKHRSAVVTLARQAARKAVKRQLQAQGIKLYSLSMKEISTLADDYLAQHSARLVADAKQIIATSPLFASWRLPPGHEVFGKIAETEHSPDANGAVAGEIVNG